MARSQLPLGYAALLCILLASSVTHSQALASGKSGSGGSRSSTSTSTTTAASSSSSGRTTYGRSVGAINRLRVVTAATLAIVYFNSQTYPAVRFYYNEYYDDCALRNVTAELSGLNDSTIDDGVFDQLPILLASSNSSIDVLAFNQTLYNVTNGLIVDSAYCNYTNLYTSGAGAARLSLLLVALLMAAAMWVALGSSVLGSGAGGRDGWESL